jgi:hypothetical protein
MSDELKPEIIRVTDTTIFERNGRDTVRVSRVEFMLGKHGPFTEDFKAGEFTETELRRRFEEKARPLRPFTSQ